VPLISIKEIQKKDNFRRSKYFKGLPIQMPMTVLANQKAEKIIVVSPN
jgi:hypothetical protein